MSSVSSSRFPSSLCVLEHNCPGRQRWAKGDDQKDVWLVVKGKPWNLVVGSEGGDLDFGSCQLTAELYYDNEERKAVDFIRKAPISYELALLSGGRSAQVELRAFVLTSQLENSLFFIRFTAQSDARDPVTGEPLWTQVAESQSIKVVSKRSQLNPKPVKRTRNVDRPTKAFFLECLGRVETKQAGQAVMVRQLVAMGKRQQALLDALTQANGIHMYDDEEEEEDVEEGNVSSFGDDDDDVDEECGGDDDDDACDGEQQHDDESACDGVDAFGMDVDVDEEDVIALSTKKRRVANGSAQCSASAGTRRSARLQRKESHQHKSKSTKKTLQQKKQQRRRRQQQQQQRRHQQVSDSSASSSSLESSFHAFVSALEVLPVCHVAARMQALLSRCTPAQRASVALALQPQQPQAQPQMMMHNNTTSPSPPLEQLLLLQPQDASRKPSPSEPLLGHAGAPFDAEGARAFGASSVLTAEDALCAHPFLSDHTSPFRISGVEEEAQQQQQQQVVQQHHQLQHQQQQQQQQHQPHQGEYSMLSSSSVFAADFLSVPYTYASV